MGSKSDQSSSIALNTMCVEDWAILGLEASVAGVLTEHPAVSGAVFTEPFPTEPFFPPNFQTVWTGLRYLRKII